MDDNARFHWQTFGCFSLLFAALIWLLADHFPPHSILWRASEHTESPFMHLKVGETFAYEFEARADNVHEIAVNHAFSDNKVEVDLTVENVSRSTIVGKQILGMGHIAEIPIEGEVRAGDRLRVTYQILKSQIERFPNIVQAVKRAHAPPFMEVDVFLDGRKLTREEIEEGMYWPLFYETYHTSIDWVRRIWWLPLVFLVPVLIRPWPRGWTAAWLVMAALIISSVSLRAYFDRTERHWTYHDPDDYGKYGNYLHQYLTGNAKEKERAHTWMKTHPHNHLPFTPVVIAGSRFLGAQTLPAMCWWAAVCSFGSIVLLHWFLGRRMHCHWRTCLLAVCLMMYHIIFFRAFSRSSTDPSGVLFAMAGIAILFERTQRRFPWWGELLFGAFLLANALARPPGLAISLLYLALAWVIDHLEDRPRRGWELVLLAALLAPFAVWGLKPFVAAAGVAGLLWLILRWKSLKLRWPASVVPTLLQAVPFLGIYAALFVIFQWDESIARNFDKADSFKRNSSWEFFHSSFLGMLYPLLAALPGWWLIGRARNQGPWLAAFWFIAFLLLLAVFEAPFYNRLFLPALPGTMILAGVAMDWAGSRARWYWLPSLLVIALSVGSGWVLSWMMNIIDPWPPEPWARWFFF